MTFDPALALGDWLATGKLSRRKLAALEESHGRGLDEISWASSINIAPSEFCEAAQLPRGSYWPVVVAAVLDQEAPLKGQGIPAHARTLEVLDLLVDYGFMEKEASEATLQALGG